MLTRSTSLTDRKRQRLLQWQVTEHKGLPILASVTICTTQSIFPNRCGKSFFNKRKNLNSGQMLTNSTILKLTIFFLQKCNLYIIYRKSLKTLMRFFNILILNYIVCGKIYYIVI